MSIAYVPLIIVNALVAFAILTDYATDAQWPRLVWAFLIFPLLTTQTLMGILVYCCCNTRGTKTLRTVDQIFLIQQTSISAICLCLYTVVFATVVDIERVIEYLIIYPVVWVLNVILLCALVTST